MRVHFTESPVHIRHVIHASQSPDNNATLRDLIWQHTRVRGQDVFFRIISSGGWSVEKKYKVERFYFNGIKLFESRAQKEVHATQCVP
jgi:hypothetical protein